MIRARVVRLMAVVSTVAVAAALTTGVASAAPPNWKMTVTKLPATVSPGAPAGYEVTIENLGSSNISSLFLVAKVNGSLDVTPVYLTSSRPGTCNELGVLSGPLFCSFGALNAGDHVTVVVAYTTPLSGSSFPVEFQGNSSGNTFSDTKGRSHGDTLGSDPKVTTTALNSGKNFAGFFSTDGVDGISNSGQLNGQNKQQAGLDGLPPGLVGTVEDGPLTTGACTNDAEEGIDCSQFDGEWAVVNVAGGNNVDGGFFVIMKYRNTSDPTAFFHSFGPADDQQILIQECGATPVAPCFTWDGASDTATILTNHNGSMIKR